MKKEAKNSQISDYTDSHVLNTNSIIRFLQLVLCILFDKIPESAIDSRQKTDLNSIDIEKSAQTMQGVIQEMEVGKYYNF